MNIRKTLLKFKKYLAEWARSLDKGLLWAIFLLIVFGVLLTFSASPEVADRVLAVKDSFHFIKKQIIFLIPSVFLMLGVSMFTPKWIWRTCVIGFIFCFILLILTPLIGANVKGARRWIYLFGISVQPSEFMKPVFAVTCAYFLYKGKTLSHFPGGRITAGLWIAVLILLLCQPDVGMSITTSCIWGSELFLAGLPILWLIILGILAAASGVSAYFFFPHVQSRINRFLDPASGDIYQVKTSLEALRNSGWFGRGPGEGIVKARLPDAHTDFILAVAAEEYGFILSACLVLLFLFILLRGFWIISKQRHFFRMVATTGLLTQFGVQAIINMASTLNLMPTKGMTLPFISYGGSSLLSLALGFGIILSLTRKRSAIGDEE